MELHFNYSICSHHIEDCYYMSKTPIIIKQGAIPTLFGTDSYTDNKDSRNVFDKLQTLQEASDSVSLTYCNMNAEISKYHDANFSNLCRMCGKLTLNGVDIFSAEGTELKLKEKINLHVPISILMDDAMPRKVCIECCNELDKRHLFIVLYLKTNIELMKFLNIENKMEYENKYNSLLKKYLLEKNEEICVNNSMHYDSASFTTNKITNFGLETDLEELENEECSETEQPDRKDNTPKHAIIYNALQNKNDKNVAVNNGLETGNSQIANKKCENKQLTDKPEVCESVQPVNYQVSSQLSKTQQNFDKCESLHENATTGVKKGCGHCEGTFFSKKDLLHHIKQLHKGQLLFRCCTCNKTYERWSSLDIHEATHRLDKPYLCDLCGKSFKHSNYLRGHRRIHLEESKKKKHVCEFCKKAFRSRFHLKEHQNQHIDNRPYTCELCGKAFYRRIQLRQHHLSHGSNKYSCPICGLTFNRKGNMNMHVKRHNNGSGAYTCSVCACKCKSMSELKMHRKNHTEEEIVDSIKRKSNDKEIWRCNVCNKVFSKRIYLVAHEHTHGNNQIYVECKECGKKLASKSSLKYHEKSMHLKEKLYMCQYCGESLVSKETQLNHERKHTGERPYVCKVCNAHYISSSNLSQHMKTHTGLKPHECGYCGKRFLRKDSLKVHERIHTGVKPYPCEICGRCFSQKNDMLKHVKTHNGKSLQCDQCDEVFRQKKDLLKHAATHEQNISAILSDVDTQSDIMQPC